MTDSDIWRIRGVDAAWSSPEGSPAKVRLDLTLRLEAPLLRVVSALREIQRSIPGTTRVVVLHVTGGPKAAAETAADGPAPADRLSTGELTDLQRAFDWTSDPSYVSVAAADGELTEPGLLLALGADVRIATAPTTLALGRQPTGLLPGFAATDALVAALGYPLALELCLAGRRLVAADPRLARLFQHVVQVDELESAVEELVSALLLPNRDDAREVKALLQRADNRPREHQRGAEREAQLRRFDDRESVAADGESRA